MRRTLASLALALAALPAAACTTFCIQASEGPVFGRNYDYGFGAGMVLVNPRGVEKVALVQGNAARWTSRYGSVTFNQFGRDAPAGGVNERGLVVEVMELPESRFPAPDGRPQLRTLEWIQYLLDGYATVEEAVAGAKRVRISTIAPAHFLLADASGDAAAIEFLGGRMVVRQGGALPDRVLANSPYADSRDYAGGHPASQGPLPRGEAGSLERFARAARAVRPLQGREADAVVEESFRVLDEVAQAGYTQWQVVYDLPRRTIHWRTTANRERRQVSLDRLAFGCGSGAKMLDVDGGRGDLSAAFEPYAPEANERQMQAAFAKSPQFRMPADAVHAEATLNEMTRRCAA